MKPLGWHCQQGKQDQKVTMAKKPVTNVVQAKVLIISSFKSPYEGYSKEGVN